MTSTNRITEFDYRLAVLILRNAVTGDQVTRWHFYYSDQWQVLEERTGTSTVTDRRFVWGVRYIETLVLKAIQNAAKKMAAKCPPCCRKAGINAVIILGPGALSIADTLHAFDPGGRCDEWRKKHGYPALGKAPTANAPINYKCK